MTGCGRRVPRSWPSSQRLTFQLHPAGDSPVTVGKPRALSRAAFPQCDLGLRCSLTILLAAVGAPVMEQDCGVYWKGCRPRSQEDLSVAGSCTSQVCDLGHIH